MNVGDQGPLGARRAAGFSDDEPAAPHAARGIADPDWDDESAADEGRPAAAGRPARAWDGDWDDDDEAPDADDNPPDPDDETPDAEGTPGAPTPLAAHDGGDGPLAHHAWRPAHLLPAPGLIGSATADRSATQAKGATHTEAPALPWSTDHDSPVTAEIPIAHAPFARPAGDDTVILQRIPEALISTPSSILEPPPPSSPGSPSLGTSAVQDDDEEPTVLLNRRAVPEAPRAAPRRSAVDPDERPGWFARVISGLPAPLRRPAILAGLAVVVVVALVAGGVLWSRDDRVPGTSSSVIAPDQVSVDHLATAADASLLGSAGWAQTQTLTTVTDDSPIALCLGKSADVPVAGETVQRSLTAGTSSLLQRIDGYPNATEAQRAFSARSAQLGRCSNVPVLLTSGLTISGLGDDAVGVRAVLQDPTPIQHVVMVVRTGATLVTLDAFQPTTAFSTDAVVKLAAAVVTRSCATSGGACPTSNATATVGVPPAGGVAGWLAVADLPRITPGYGRWTAADPSSTIKVTGTQCENVTLADVPGPTARAQRSYVLTEDPKAPQLFGVDQVNLTFATAAEAADFATTITDNITNCPSRVATAKVSQEPDASGTGAQGEAISVRVRTVVQTTAASQPVKYRVALVVVGSKAIYLFANSSDAFDFTAADWTQIAVRAGERATQS